MSSHRRHALALVVSLFLATGPASAAVLSPVEDDVRAAAKASRRIVIGPKTIVTPAARDLGEALRILDQG